MRHRSIRFATITVTGLGLFVAASVGITLYLSATAGVRSTQALLAGQAEALVDDLEHRLDALLRPVVEQSRWIAEEVASGRLDLSQHERLDAFMRGALGATPQVATISLVSDGARLRRWRRDEQSFDAQDWSDRSDIVRWVAEGRTRREPSWRPPLWASTRQSAVLLHDTPLYRDGRYLGMLAQVVPVNRLSRDLATSALDIEATPFILYGASRVLAHPGLAHYDPGKGAGGDPLPGIGEINDPVLAEFSLGGPGTPFARRTLTRTQAVVAQPGGEHYLYLFRDIRRYGPEPWTLGAYVNVQRSETGLQLRRVMHALFAGLAVLVVAVLVAAFAGRRLSRPVQEFGRAAKAVRQGRFEDVPVLPRSPIREFDDASRSFNQMIEGLRERTMIRETLGRFVSEEVARSLVSAGGRLDPVEAEATVLVCDLEGFTPLTESLGPSGVVEFLNAYFGVMTEILDRHRGTITQFQGDAIVAVFNVPITDPDHAANALRAALEMIAATDTGRFAGAAARNRIGIATGRLVAGAVGARGRLSYTVHGNPVNLASRLEALNKDFGTRILVAAETAAHCPGFRFRRIGEVEVRGYAEAVSLHVPEEMSGAVAVHGS
jgi:class 3 adenylate cyclase